MQKANGAKIYHRKVINHLGNLIAKRVIEAGRLRPECHGSGTCYRLISDLRHFELIQGRFNDNVMWYRVYRKPYGGSSGGAKLAFHASRDSIDRPFVVHLADGECCAAVLNEPLTKYADDIPISFFSASA